MVVVGGWKKSDICEMVVACCFLHLALWGGCISGTEKGKRKVWLTLVGRKIWYPKNGGCLLLHLSPCKETENQESDWPCWWVWGSVWWPAWPGSTGRAPWPPPTSAPLSARQTHGPVHPLRKKTNAQSHDLKKTLYKNTHCSKKNEKKRQM